MKSTSTVYPPKKKERRALRFMIIVGCISMLCFSVAFLSFDKIDNLPLYILLCTTLFYSGARILYEWYHYWDISMPLEKEMTKVYSVDVLTTFFPGEPYEMIENTLLAIKNISYPHTTILCDEANDPYLIDFCKEHGIKHISRNNRIDAKAGNINNALRKIAKGEICVILDPDHVPAPDFLDRTLPYFQDENIGFVQVVQAYKNIHESYVAKGAAQQTFQFYGPIMMTMNSYGTVNAIGANCTFRRAALDDIGGHAAGLSEDMHTAMQIHAKGWKSVYVPIIVARGLVPASLTAYYKQQLKWSRGTTDLLAHVYPKLFKKFNWRQRIHYGLIPLHYIVGFFYLINFLIPIISLCFSITPWKGNVLFFGVSVTPVIAAIIIIRNYVQRWVMEETERGFHAVGGLLQIGTWWIFCLGCIYTLFGKKIPYLPTPKTGADKTSWKILAPNIIIGVVSLFSIAYGLYKNLTPFSIFMAGFAFLNASFMFFTIYLGHHKSKQLKNIKNPFSKKAYETNLKVKVRLWKLRHAVYSAVRKTALPTLIAVMLVTISWVYYDNYEKWDGVSTAIKPAKLSQLYLGIYEPKVINGHSNADAVAKMEKELNIAFDITSHYIPWGNTKSQNSLNTLLKDATKNGHTPLITWEPWSNDFSFSIKNGDLLKNRHIFKHILNGYFDDYIQQTATVLKQFRQPVYLRFAHEFDNPAYPWSDTGGNTSVEFKEAWIYVWKKFKELKVTNVKWIWSPWKPKAVKAYYPGHLYVDIVGITALNYGNHENFEDLYLPFRTAFKSAGIQKPVMLAEFGSLQHKTPQTHWLQSAIDAVENRYPEIQYVILFNSNIDRNAPQGRHLLTALNWKVADLNSLRTDLWKNEHPKIITDTTHFSSPHLIMNKHKTNAYSITKNRKGVVYKKGINWYKNYYTLDVKTIEEDFTLMKSMGLNGIKYYGSSIYNYNIFKTAQALQMEIDYAFWIPKLTSFGHRNKESKRVRNEILHEIHKLKDNKAISSWHIGNDLLSDIEALYKEDQANIKQHEYVKWLRDLTDDIKRIDTVRPIIVDVDLNKRTSEHIKKILDESPSIDALGLNIRNAKDTLLLKSFVSFAHQNKIAFMIGEVVPGAIDALKPLYHKNKSFYVGNWQDRRESNLLSFDGLLDYKGAFKPEFYAVKGFLNKTPYKKKTMPKINILRPAVRLQEDYPYRYTAVFEDKDDGWTYDKPDGENTSMEWLLIKCNAYGNPMVMKSIGNQKSVVVQIPELHTNYLLVFKYYEGNKVQTVIKTLNTPAKKTY